MNSPTSFVLFFLIFLFVTNESLSQNGNSPGAPWKTLGNTIKEGRFIGTLNAADFVMKTNDTERARITQTGRVGIGTDSPGAKLMLVGEDDLPTSSAFNVTNSSLQSLLHVKSDGKTGLGTGSPLSTLQIQQGTDADLDVNTGAGYLIVGNPAGENIVLDNNEIMARDAGNASAPAFSSTLHVQADGGDVRFHNNLDPSKKVIITGDGTVGIGTTTPDASLDINGNMSFDGSEGDKVSLFGSRFGQTNMYGFGIATNSLYYKANGSHKWYSQTNPGSSDAKMTLNSQGFLGLGTEFPNVTMVIEANNARLALRDNAGDNSANSARIELLENAGGNFNDGSFLWWNGAEDKLLIGTKEGGTNTNVMVINHSGLNVGIGTSQPDDNYRLSVNGKVRCKEVVVETGWPDFVFEEDYHLLPLEEVNAHIEEHGHLPGIPSAKEVEENGIGVGQIESLLLQKIEELTLYMIDMKEENEKLKNRVAELENRMD